MPLCRETSVAELRCKPGTRRQGVSNSRFADSSAIKAILIGAQAAEERGVTYELVNPHERVRRLLEVTGLANVLTIVDEPAYQEGPNSL
jgi:anti-anti-sigma factor